MDSLYNYYAGEEIEDFLTGSHECQSNDWSLIFINILRQMYYANLVLIHCTFVHEFL